MWFGGGPAQWGASAWGPPQTWGWKQGGPMPTAGKGGPSAGGAGYGKGMGMGPMAGFMPYPGPMSAMAGPDTMGLANRVKAIQKTEGGALQWSQWLERHVTSKRDPSRHNAKFLEDFLNEVDAGGGSGYGNVSGYGGAYVGFVGKGAHSMNMDMTELVQQVKHGQRNSEAFKEAWAIFLAQNDTTKRDPAKHEPAFLAKFLATAPEVPGDASMIKTSSSLPPIDIQDDHHQEIINRVKHGQRTSMEFKDLWIQYVREYGQDLRDPSRHDAVFLETFLSTAPAYGESEKEDVIDDEEHRSLVEQIKEQQRASEFFKEAWARFVQPQKNIRDPVKHPTSVLLTFLQSMGSANEQFDSSKRPSKGFGKGGKNGGKNGWRMSPY